MANIKASEISSILQMQLQNMSNKVQFEEIGKVLQVSDGVAHVYGLDKVQSNELVEFENGTMGVVLNLEEDNVGVVLLGPTEGIKEGETVKRTQRIASVMAGEGMLGRVVDGLGRPIDGKGPIQGKTYEMPLERKAPGVIFRQPVNQPLQTGLKAIDAMIPIGRGQRELIIGDRQTGKTAIAIDAIINQKGKDVLCIYVAIGQKASTVAQLVEKLRQNGAMDYTTVVVATASESAPMLYIAPYAGCAIGEEWMEEGKHVLIVYDDLSKHAVAYRAMSLLLRRPPGREAFPGDVFYLHSRLLERACKLNDDLGGGSITALPIIETQAGDISAYIPTNVISITDGQLFLQTELFNAGIRPAVDSGLSVSRVGSAAQTKAMKSVAKSLKLELAQYAELLSFTQFGSDLDPITQKTIDHGARLQAVLVQPQYAPLTMPQQVVSLYAVEHGFMDTIDIERISAFERALHRDMQAKHALLLDAIEEKGVLDDDMVKELEAGITESLNDFMLINGA